MSSDNTESINDQIKSEILPRNKRTSISEIVKENKERDIAEVANMVQGFLIESNTAYKSVLIEDGNIIIHLYGTSYYYNHSADFKNHSF